MDQETYDVLQDILSHRYGTRLHDPAKRIHKKFFKKLEILNVNQADFVRFLNGSGVSDFDRIRHVSNTFDVGEVAFGEKVVSRYFKSSIISKGLRDIGNHAYKALDFNLALSAYSKAVLFAPVNGENSDLALAFANRSAVFCETRKYTECILDIDRALRAGYPTGAKQKLLDRARKCQEGLEKKSNNNVSYTKFSILNNGEQESEETKLRRTFCTEKIFRLINPNLLIPAAEDFVIIKATSERGRHLIATADVKPGTVLIVDEPYSKVILNELKWDTERCHHCHRSTSSGIPCSSCSFAYYCSDSCRDAAREGCHIYECACAPYFHCLMPVRIFLLALRTVTKLGPSGIEDRFLNGFSASNSDDGILGSDKGIYKSNSYNTIYHLISHAEKCGGHELLSYAITSLSLVRILDKYSSFFESWSADLDKEKVKCFAASLILRHVLNLPCNAHSLYALKGEGVDYNEDWIRMATAQEYGAGAFGVLSLINHSCDPNVLRVNNSQGQVAVIALKCLRAGDELLDNYGHHYALENYSSRRKSLSSNYYFECGCLPCSRRWPLLAELKTLPAKFLCQNCAKDNARRQEVLLPVAGRSDTLSCSTCGIQYSSQELINELDLDVDEFFVAHEMLLKNEPLEAIPRLIKALTYFTSKVDLPFIRINDTEETYKQALNLIITSAEESQQKLLKILRLPKIV